jgi:hypothetical protein
MDSTELTLKVEGRKLLYERTKLALDLVKHLSTLATGSLVLIATLLERFPKPLREQDTLIWSVVCFVVCTVACTAYWFFGAILGHWFETDWSHRQVRAWFLVLAFVLTVSFVLGVTFLGIFAARNITAA